GYPDPSRADGVRHVYFPNGKVQMDGQMALDFARSRLSTSVYDRMRRQMRVLLGVREKLLSADVFPHIPDLWSAASNLVQTDVPARTILPLAKLGSEMKLSDVHALTIDGAMVRQTTSSQGWWILMPDLDRIHNAVRNLFTSAAVSDTVKRNGCG
ncbi:MAG: LCP family protein, partial [Chloroflexi bacterium]|nr:LCP family protein [Chloroflexota bacterium]